MPGSTLRRARAGRPAGQGRPAVQLFPEDAGVGLPEAVDALLQVAHEEQIVPCWGGKAAVNGVLQSVGVLVFVHHHGGVVLPDAPAQLGGGAVRPAQQPQGKMFKIAEFQQLALFFPGRKPGVEVPHGVEQRPQPGQGGFAVGFGFFLAAGDELGDLPEQGGGFLRAGLDRRLVFAGQPLFHALQAGCFLHAQYIGREPVIQRRPLACPGQPFHLAQQGGGVFQPEQRFGKFIVDARHSLGFGSRRLAFFLGLHLRQCKVCPAVGQRRRQQFPGGFRAPGRFGQQQVVPTGGIKAVLLLPRGQILVQAAVVVRQGAQKIVRMQDGIPRRFVGAALAVKVGKSAEIRVAVGVFQRFGKCRRPQHFHAAGVCRGEIRRDIQRLKVLVQQVQTESVNGADGCPLQQHPLAAQGGIAGLCLTAAQQGLPDAGPQLCRRRIRKGDDEQPVGVHRVFRVGDEPHGALGQHSCFAAARRRAHQQRAAPVVDGGLLGRSPFGSTHASSPSFPVSSDSSGSKGLAGASSARSPMPVSWQQIKL